MPSRASATLPGDPVAETPAPEPTPPKKPFRRRLVTDPEELRKLQHMGGGCMEIVGGIRPPKDDKPPDETPDPPPDGRILIGLARTPEGLLALYERLTGRDDLTVEEIRGALAKEGRRGRSSDRGAG